MALTPTDRLLAGYLTFVTVMIAVRGMLPGADGSALLTMHALFGGLLFLFTRLRAADRTGGMLHDLYPVLMLVPFYREFGIMNGRLDLDRILAHDAVVQRWEAALFGGQISYDWIRAAPSVFWSGLFHFAYFGFYAIVVFGPLLARLRGGPRAARSVVFSMMLAFVPCYATFLLYPVAGPYYTFLHPTGPVRDLWSADLVYGVLAGSSSIGAAFPSSHVAAAVAVVMALYRYRPRLAHWFAVPCGLLAVGTVYCQMHYGVDALAGLVVGLLAGWAGTRMVPP
jgi:membrane-associated phospholipid phosphatase